MTAANPVETSPTPMLFQRLRSWRQRLIPFAGLALIILVFTILAGDRFFSASNAGYVLQQAAITAIPAFGVTLIIIAGSIDLSVGSVVALTGVVSAQIAIQAGEWWAVPAGLAMGALCGLVNGLAFAYMKVPSFIVTLGMLFVARGAAVWISNSSPISVDGPVEALGAPPGLYLVLLGAIIVSGVLLHFTVFGRQLVAVGGQERVAGLSGVPVRRVKVLVFVIAGLFAGLGGIVLSARVGAATPTAATGFELTAIAAAVLGGTPLTGGYGTVVSTLFGALTLTALLNGLVIIGVGAELQTIVQGLVLVIAVWLSLDRKKIGVIK